MKQKFFKLYQAALLTYLKQGSAGRLEPALGMGAQAMSASLQTLDMAKFHEEILVAQVLPAHSPSQRPALIRRAGVFFAAAITPIEKTHSSAREATAHLKRFIEMLSQRTVELAASNLELNMEIAQRKVAEDALKKSKLHYSQLLERSDRLQAELRRLSRQILSVQEDERKRISLELHDVIAQTLTGINVRLATLKKEASLNKKGLDRNITLTQRLVEKSVNIVHEFARELRPAVLDDLGLIPALHSFMKLFTARTGVRIHLTAFAGVEELDISRRTTLFRIAQEALTNVGRHAHASRAEVLIQKLPDGVCMKIKDNGKSFQVDRVLLKGGKRLGLIGMRERLEMVGGHFEIESTPGQGTTITAQLPLDSTPARPMTKARTKIL